MKKSNSILLHVGPDKTGSSAIQTLVWHQASVTRDAREQRNGRRAVLLWFTGLSGSGKSTLAHAVEQRLHQLGASTFVLDGDNVRHGLCRDLAFSEADRMENIRRVAEVAKLFLEAGIITLAAFIAPFAADRARARALFAEADFLEIYCDCPLNVCEQRDVKGLYRKARAGAITDFTGISSPYEVPDAPELVVDTRQTLEASVDVVLQLLQQCGVLA